MVSILGVRTRFSTTRELFEKIAEVSKKHSLFLQAFNPDSVLLPSHLEHAFELAARSFKSNSNIARTMEAELLVRAAATPKIDKAIERIGVKNPKKIILFSDRKIGKKIIEEFGKREDKLLELTEQKKKKIAKRFGIGEAELKLYSLEELIFEKMALAE